MITKITSSITELSLGDDHHQHRFLFLWKHFFFRKMADFTIFEDLETFREFQELYQIIILSLNECNNGIKIHCSPCVKIVCSNYAKFKELKWSLF